MIYNGYDINRMWETPILSAIVLGGLLSICVGIFIFEFIKGND